MTKTILLTGATDGIGFETAKFLAINGHKILLHGRSTSKIDKVKAEFLSLTSSDKLESYVADLSDLSATANFADKVASDHTTIDALINNAGIYVASTPMTSEGLDLRFVVNTLAPYIITQRLKNNFRSGSRVVNVSSAAQAPIDIEALQGRKKLNDGDAYAQSKLAITMWTQHLAKKWGDAGPVLIAVNPASMLGSKMVKDAYGVDGNDLQIGADILSRAALSDEFSTASGKYYDNDRRSFSRPHPDAQDEQTVMSVIRAIDALINQYI